MILGLAAAFSLAAGCGDGVCNAHVLDPYFARLAAAAGPGPRAGKPAHILQIGDSHTAGDAITGAWRDLLQARYGAGGRGVLPPGRPYDGYLTHGVQVTMSPGWTIAATFGPASRGVRPPIGLSGFSLTSQREGARMALAADPAERFDRLVVCAIARPGGGSLAIAVGGRAETMDLGSVSERPECRTIRTEQAQTAAELVTQGGPVTITSWATFNDAGGVALSNLGVVGSQLVHFARTDDAVLGEELRAYAPDLIVIAFGTNEGFAPRFSPFEYEIVLRTQIGRIRRLAGHVPILLLGAPDASSRRPEVRANSGGAPAEYCADGGTTAAVTPTPAVAGPGGLSGVMERLRETFGTAAPPDAAPPPAAPAGVRTALFTPPALAAVRDVQRRVATSLHVAFWDWDARMGGRCAAVRWTRASPPLMRGDYVHYTSAGGRELAARLQADLDQAAGR